MPLDFQISAPSFWKEVYCVTGLLCHSPLVTTSVEHQGKPSLLLSTFAIDNLSGNCSSFFSANRKINAGVGRGLLFEISEDNAILKSMPSTYSVHGSV